MVKRLVTLFLTICILFLTFVPDIIAVESQTEYDVHETQSVEQDNLDTEAPEQTETQAEISEAADEGKHVSSKSAGTVYSCVYDSKEQKIRISGSVTHDIFIKHRDYSIRLYKVGPAQTLASVVSEGVVEPLASTEISIKFNFTADVTSVVDIFSQYVVVLASSEGNIDYIGPQLYPSVASDYTFKQDRKSYKGIVINGSDTVYQSEPSVSVIPVYLDKLVSSGAMGYLHSLDGKNVFFDREYIDYLDRSVRTLSDSGAKIYFQLLLNRASDTVLNTSVGDEGASARYDIPDLYSPDVMNEIYTYCDFLSKRYSSYKNGYISGMIIGKKLDDVESFNNNIYGSEDEYTRALSLYGMIVGIATRNNIPSADIAYSFTNTNTYEQSYSEGDYASSNMIEALSRYFEDYYSDVFDYSLVLESEHRPLSITNDMLDEGIDLARTDDGEYIVERRTDIFVNFLNTLDKKYSSAPASFMYVWSVDEGLHGNALACAYSYLYYKFYSIDKLSALVVNFENSPEALYDILNIIKYIDTDKGIDVTSQLLQFFKEYSWSQVVYGFDRYDYSARDHEIIYGSPDVMASAGEFFYFDFDVASNVSSWFAGKGCSDVSIAYNSLFGRALTAHFKADSLSPTDYAYILCSYEYPEDFVYTPRLTFSFSIEGETGTSDIFEVKISFHNGRNVYEYSNVVQTGRERQMVVDLSEFSQKFMAESIRISVRPMSEASGEYAFNLSSIKGQSAELTNAELDEKISAQRLLIRNSASSLDALDDGEINIVVVVMATVIALIIGVMLFVFLKREE